MRVRHDAVALDVANDPAGRVPDLNAPPVAGIVNVPDPLARGVSDRPAGRGRGGRGRGRRVALAIAHNATGGRLGARQDHGHG